MRRQAAMSSAAIASASSIERRFDRLGRAGRATRVEAPRHALERGEEVDGGRPRRGEQPARRRRSARPAASRRRCASRRRRRRPRRRRSPARRAPPCRGSRARSPARVSSASQTSVAGQEALVEQPQDAVPRGRAGGRRSAAASRRGLGDERRRRGAADRRRASAPPPRGVGDGVQRPSVSTAIACTRRSCLARISWPIFSSAAIQRGVEAVRARSRRRRAGPAGGSAARRRPPRATRRAATRPSRTWRFVVRIVEPPGVPQTKTPPSADHRDRRAHRGEHPLAGGDGVDLSLDEAVDVGLARAASRSRPSRCSSRKPRPGATRALPKESFNVVVTETTIPSPSTTEKCVVVGVSRRATTPGGRRRRAVADRSSPTRRAGAGGSAKRLLSHAARRPDRRGSGCGRGRRASRSRRASAADRRRARGARSGPTSSTISAISRQDRARGGRRRREDVGAAEAEAEGRADLRRVAREVAARDQAAGALLSSSIARATRPR